MLFSFLPILSFLFLSSTAFASPSLSSTNYHDGFKRAVVTVSKCPPNKILAQYFPAWQTDQTPSQMNWKSTDFGYYFVAITTATGITNPAGQTDPNVFVAAAHKNLKRALITIGGWTGSRYFSDLVSTDAKRKTFANNLISFMKKYKFDGIDIDWEFIGAQGEGSNIVSKNDAANFLSFLQILKPLMGTNIITAAVPTNVFIGPDGNPLINVAAYANYLTYITIMAYDMYGPWSDTTGPNAPLDICTGTLGGGKLAVQNWINAKFPKCQILLGIPTYSHSFKTASSALMTKSIKSADGKSSISTKMFQALDAVQPEDPGYTYNKLISMKYLNAAGTAGMNGFTRIYDACTSTPFLFNPTTKIFISYDDQASTSVKTKFVRDMGLAGVNFFESTGTLSSTFDQTRVMLNS